MQDLPLRNKRGQNVLKSASILFYPGTVSLMKACLLYLISSFIVLVTDWLLAVRSIDPIRIQLHDVQLPLSHRLGCHRGIRIESHVSWAKSWIPQSLHTHTHTHTQASVHIHTHTHRLIHTHTHTQAGTHTLCTHRILHTRAVHSNWYTTGTTRPGWCYNVLCNRSRSRQAMEIGIRLTYPGHVHGSVVSWSAEVTVDTRCTERLVHTHTHTHTRAVHRG